MSVDPKLVDDLLEMQRAYEEAKGLGGLARVAEPAARAMGRFVPEGLVKDGLARADDMAGRTAPAWLRRVDTDDFAACAAAADRVQRQAVIGSAVSGVASGVTGAAGLTADMAVSFAVAARTIRLTAMAYGFGGDGAEDRVLRAHALDLAMQGTGAARRAKTNYIKALLNGAKVAPSVPVAGPVVEEVAVRAGRLLLQRYGGAAAARVVPLASSAVGGVVNYRLQSAVAGAADYTYRARWLAARKALPAPVLEDVE
ncbi:MAG: EcsC family protein [Pseudomonadota bacterium]